ncbi:hypothetical protein C9374_013743 [Naegleria lovaniensis]|uniref:F-box domain-containing protein n=1 Tax=Naegleria lovaniensis TaxID=51637 RepID=A0AA88GBG2_NAELO|nr:uncharacterized protein C9374_013743 [Naegleria lovaniensis]KAG2370908.1 hypothetical protein C9374_013743 [Naegleria lovaniensis]
MSTNYPNTSSYTSSREACVRSSSLHQEMTLLQNTTTTNLVALPQELVEIIFEFLDDHSRMQSEWVCSKFHEACNQVERRELREWWKIVNMFLKAPLVEAPAFTNDDEFQEYFHQHPDLPNLSFHVKEFLKFNNGTCMNNRKQKRSFGALLHPSRVLVPFSNWKRTFFEKTKRECWVVGMTYHDKRVFLDGPLICVEDNSKEWIHFKYWVITQCSPETFKDIKRAASDLRVVKLLTRDSSLPLHLSEFQFMNNAYCLNYSPKEVLSNGNFITRLMKRNPALFKYVNRHFNQDREIAKIVLEQYPNYFTLLSPELRDDEKAVKLAVSKSGQLLRFASTRLQDHQQVVMTALQQDGNSLAFCSDTLRSDRSLVLTAVKNTGQALTAADPKFRQDYEIVFEAVRNFPHALANVSPLILQNHREIATLAVSQDPTAFACLTVTCSTNQELYQSFKQDKELVMLSKNLQNASIELQDDQEFVMKMIEIDPFSYEHASDRLKRDRQVALKAVSLNGSVLEFVPKELRSEDHPNMNHNYEITNWQIVLTAVTQDGFALRFAPPTWRNNFEMVKVALENDGLALKYASKEIQDCLDMVLIALKQNIGAIDYVSSRLQVSPEVINFTHSCRNG